MIFHIYILLLVYILPLYAVWDRFDLVRNRTGAWGSNETISFIKFSRKNTIPILQKGGNFGYSVANIGDLDGDGYDDIAVGAPGESYVDSTGQVIAGAGAVYIILLAGHAAVTNYTRIGHNATTGLILTANDQFGFSVAGIGDLDGDGVNDIVVGAPGYIISSAYILFLYQNGSVKDSTLIRGEYQGTLPPGVNSTTFNISTVSNYTYNGPPITYGSRFSTALANMGDINGDNITDLAVSSVDNRRGATVVYLLRLLRNGTVSYYTTIGPRRNGGPDIPLAFTGYGTSVMPFPDLNNDSIPEMVVGAPFYYETGSTNPNSGEVFIHFMKVNGSAKNTSTISETANGKFRGTERQLPYVPYDECGSSLTYIGDINRDRYSQRRPWLLSTRRFISIPDIVMGCPQSRSSAGSGRLFFVYLDLQGQVAESTAIPALTDDETIIPHLSPYDQFGNSLAAYHDIDQNGIREILVGAPGDDTEEEDSGAVYIIFPRRRRYFWIPFDFLTFILLVTLIPGICCCLCIMSIIYFFWYFRRVPDQAEILVKQAGLHIQKGQPRPRKMYEKQPGRVYVHEYTL